MPASTNKAALSGFLLAMLACWVFAAKVAVAAAKVDDSTVLLSARKTQLNQSANSITYTGNVQLSHKTLTIRGTRATASGISRNEKYVTLSGSPVTSEFIDRTGRKIVLSSNSVHYDSGKRVVTALEEAQLKSDDGLISAYRISYELATDRFSVSGDANSSRVSAFLKVRTTASIQP